MSDRDVYRSVAQATGETVESIEQRGFHLLDLDASCEPLGPLVMDWDEARPAYLQELLSDDDWPGRVEPLPTYDETYGEEEFAGVAA